MNTALQHINNVIDQFDTLEQPFSESEVVDALRKKLDEAGISNDEFDEESWAEWMAFWFVGDLTEGPSDWGTYFKPAFVRVDEHGDRHEWPTIQKVSRAVLQHWLARSGVAKHPVLKARYCDLVWDFSKLTTGSAPAISVARQAIDSYQSIINGKRHKYVMEGVVKLCRGLDLALMINDHERIQRMIHTMITFEDEFAEDELPGTWGFSFNELVENKKVPLVDSQQVKIIRDLEDRLHRLTGVSLVQKNGPHAAESAAMPLARYYRRLGQAADMYRVLRSYGKACIKASESAEPLVAYAWLMRLYEIFADFGMHEDAHALDGKLHEIGQRTSDNLHAVSHEVSIPNDVIEAFLDQLIATSLSETLVRIAGSFLPNRNDVKDQVLKLAKHAPIQAIVRRHIQDHEGRIVASIGSVEDDLEGRIVAQIGDNMAFMSPLLNLAFDRTIAQFGLSAQDLQNHCKNAPIFDESNLVILCAGLEHYFEKQYLEAIHLLVPQIEAALRNLLKLTGGSIYKQIRNGGFQLRTIDEILRDRNLVNSLGEDMTTYFRSLLSDPRAWNVRNSVCHGLLPREMFNRIIADRLVHILLLLAIVREVSDTTE